MRFALQDLGRRVAVACFLGVGAIHAPSFTPLDAPCALLDRVVVVAGDWQPAPQAGGNLSLEGPFTGEDGVRAHAAVRATIRALPPRSITQRGEHWLDVCGRRHERREYVGQPQYVVRDRATGEQHGLVARGAVGVLRAAHCVLGAARERAAIRREQEVYLRVGIADEASVQPLDNSFRQPTLIIAHRNVDVVPLLPIRRPDPHAAEGVDVVGPHQVRREEVERLLVGVLAFPTARLATIERSRELQPFRRLARALDPIPSFGRA